MEGRVDLCGWVRTETAVYNKHLETFDILALYKFDYYHCYYYYYYYLLLLFFSDGADVVSSGRVFQTRGPATVKTLLPTVESLTAAGTSRLLELTEHSVRRPGDSKIPTTET